MSGTTESYRVAFNVMRMLDVDCTQRLDYDDRLNDLAAYLGPKLEQQPVHINLELNAGERRVKILLEGEVIHGE